MSSRSKRRNSGTLDRNENRDENESLTKRRKVQYDSILSQKLRYLVELREISEPADPDRRFRLAIPSGQYSMLNQRGQTFFRLASIDFEEKRDLAELVALLTVKVRPIAFGLNLPYGKDMETLMKALKRHTKTVGDSFKNYMTLAPSLTVVNSGKGSSFYFNLLLTPRTIFYTYDPHILVALGFTELPVRLGEELVPNQDPNKIPYGYFNPFYDQPQTLRSLTFPPEFATKVLRSLANTLPFPYEDPVGSRITYNVIKQYRDLAERIRLAELPPEVVVVEEEEAVVDQPQPGPSGEGEFQAPAQAEGQEQQQPQESGGAGEPELPKKEDEEDALELVPDDKKDLLTKKEEPRQKRTAQQPTFSPEALKNIRQNSDLWRRRDAEPILVLEPTLPDNWPPSRAGHWISKSFF